MEVRLLGDFSDISIWNDAWEVEGPPAPLHAREYPKWERALHKSEGHLALVGGEAVAKQLGLMLVERGAWNDGRGPALGFPIYEDGVLVNLVRRFLDAQTPKYQGLRGRGHQFWPDRSALPSIKEPILLVCGMRDVCTARKYGIHAYSTTGGVNTWPDEWLEWLAAGRHFKVIFDMGEEQFALNLVERLRTAGSASAWMRRLPPPLRAGEDLTDLERIFGGVGDWLHAQMNFRGHRPRAQRHG